MPSFTMKTKNSGILSLLVLATILFSCAEKQQVNNTLPRSTPEEQGVSSQGILDFLTAADTTRGLEFHSFMIVRHGNVIAEGWWNPYAPELRHTMYSVSKSFASTAVGYAVGEGLLSVEDKVISFFPEFLPDTFSPFLSEMSVKNLLCMSTGQEKEQTFEIDKYDNWAEAFLNVPVVYEPGSKFAYNSMATYMLSAITQRVTGETIFDYLTPRLFDPLNIQGIDWESDPEGINTGGWGLRLKTEDMAKFGQLLLQKGEWNGKQILSADWIAEATAKQIEQRPDLTEAQRAENDRAQGYCYQFWRCRHNGFRADGAFGQYIIVLPDQDAVIAITSGSGRLDPVWEYLIPAMHERALPANEKAEAELKRKTTSLALPLPESKIAIQNAEESREFMMQPNDQQIEAIKLNTSADKVMLSLVTDEEAYDFNFGNGEWIAGETNKKSISIVPYQWKGLLPFKVMGAYRWVDENTLEMTLRYIETPHHETYTFIFENDKPVVFEMRSNIGNYSRLEEKPKL